MQPPITDYDIQAYIDEELTLEEKKRVLYHIRNNDQARLRYEELCNQARMLNMWWKQKSRHH